jgi:prevent-host-death family protein
MNMTTISEAKSHLSALLRRVQQGETVLILHRGRAVARLSPITAADDLVDEDRLARLERAGLIRRALEPPDARLLDEAVPVLTEATGLVQALLAERAEAR